LKNKPKSTLSALKIFPIVSYRFLPKQRKEYRARIIAHNPAKL